MSALEPGVRAPEFVLADRHGILHSLASVLAGGPAWVTFFKIACPTCQFVLPYVGRLMKLAPAAAHGLITISQDPPDHTAAFSDEFGVELPMLFDSEEQGFAVSESYGITHVPTFFLVEPGGKIARTSVGWVREEFEDLVKHFTLAYHTRPGSLFARDEDVPTFRGGCGSKN